MNMKMTLSEIVADINRGKKTGILSIAIRGDDKNLLKIFFKDGDVYHLTCGAQKDFDCLGQCDTLDFSSSSFLPNAKSDVARSASLPATSEIIRILEKKNVPIEVMGLGAKTAAAGGAGAAASGNFAKIQEELKVALIRQIGPAGGKVLKKVVEEAWHVSSPTKADLQKLVGLLKDEIEDGENRNQFVKEAEKIIA
jgi:hypothetical protein